MNVAKENPSKKGKGYDGLLLGVSLRNWDVGIDPRKWEMEVADAIDAFLSNYPEAKAVFIPFQNSNGELLDDREISKRVQSRLRNSERTEISGQFESNPENNTVLAQCDLVLGMRLHSLILAAIVGTPVIGLIYDPKVKILMSQLGMAQFGIELDKASCDYVSSKIEEVLISGINWRISYYKTAWF